MGVLDLYAEPHAPARPVVCFKVSSKQTTAEARATIRRQFTGDGARS